MQDKTAYNRLYLIAAIWMLYGVYRILRALSIEYASAGQFGFSQIEHSHSAEMLVFGSFCLAIGFGLLLRSKFMSLELLSLPLALLAYSIIWSILQADPLTYFLQLDYLALLFILPTQQHIRPLQFSPGIKQWSLGSILFWVMVELFLFNGVIYLLV